MTEQFKFAAIQLNPTVGDLDGNYQKHIQMIREAVDAGADFVIFPEMSLTGYPLEDLVLRPSFVEAVEFKTLRLAQEISETFPNVSVIFGGPRFSADKKRIFNSAFYVDQGKIARTIDKVELPNYGVFDEKRVFTSGGEPYPVDFRGYQIGVMICEDAWFPRVSRSLHENGAVVLIAVNGSPFEMGKNVTRRKVVAKRVRETGLPMMYINMVGGQDELVFDGGSFYWDGQKIQEAPNFKEGVFIWSVELDQRSSHFWNGNFYASILDDGRCVGWKQPPRVIARLDTYPKVSESGIREVYQAIHLGTRDYLNKQRRSDGTPLFKSVVLGYSGGVDSGIVAAIAADAIGPSNVHLVRLPSKYSSEGSLIDAENGARRLDAKMRTIEIEPVVESLRLAYQSSQYSYLEGSKIRDEWMQDLDPPALNGIADENIQARARGNILMAISNQEGHLLLTTGNKSEVSVGYSTLYGDMSGGYNPIKDAYKTTVWDLCRWRNSLSQEEINDLGFLGRATHVVPEEIINKPPSAELRPDQKDEDSLPPYPILDSILKGMIEKEQSVEELISEGYSSEFVIKVRNLVDNSEYKRRQAAPGVKLTSRLHGRDRRYPIVNAWRS